MNVVITRLRIVSLSCALTFAAAASAAVGPPPPIQSYQGAKQAIMLADQLQYSVPGLGWTLIGDGFYMGEGARRALLAAITPAALARTPGGITLNCVQGGTLTARSTRNAPRDIDIEFQECRPYQSLRSIATGPLRLTLLADSFVFEKIAGMHLGNADRDLVVTQTYEFPGNTLKYTWTYQAVARGRIAWPFNVQADMVPHPSQYEINGTSSLLTVSEHPGEQPSVSIVTTTADHLNMSTLETFGNEFEYEERQTAFLSGIVTQDVGPPAARFTTTYEFAELSFSTITDFLGGTQLFGLKGGLRYALVNGERSSCQNGDYLFRTKSPLRRPSMENLAYDSGELVINRSVNVRPYSAATVPAGLPTPVNGMLVHVEVANVGTFDRDTYSLGDMSDTALCDF